MSSPVSDLPPQHSTVLLTPRLRLRPVRPSDLHPLHAIRRDPTAMTYMSSAGADPEPIAEKSDSVRRIHLMMMPDRFSFAVELREPSSPRADPLSKDQASTDTAADSPPELIGFLGCHRIPEVFYLFASAHWGKGYATEALKAWLECYWKMFPEGLPGMKEEGVEGFIEGHHFVGNMGSGKVLEKSGFVRLREKVVEGEAGDRDAVVYRIMRPANGKAEGKVDSGNVVEGAAEVTAAAV